ncbi:hypothetical protein AMS68_008062 [Peltaster fructicola]|uniref:Large ribosomal subunit protein bL27m n=1 Tax=Peltaster fructicola TaxID=286661 RepID=A0A6H0Y6M6_9PEZI|nr:hypothetical protein AMS68_008062 [Peltaster fructicola]
MASHLTIALRALEIRPSSTKLRTAAQYLPVTARRNASHQAQGRANKAKQGPGKRLGAKKTGGEYVVTGNIIYKQRGTLWFPGDNCFMGRDHTIHAAEPGYVRYYRDPLRHPKRKYIGVVFNKEQELPQPPNAPRVRRLGMLAFQKPGPVQDALSTVEEQNTAIAAPQRRRKSKIEPLKPTLRPGYQYRIANWEIGQEAERVGTAKRVVPFQPGNRWIAWRKRNEAKARVAEKRALGRGGKKKPVKM